jgi:hypothetical protein
MKNILLFGIAGAAALVTIAPTNAADLGLRPMYAVRPFTWSGCYIGGNIGGGWGRESVSIPNLGETTGIPELAGVSLPPRYG